MKKLVELVSDSTITLFWNVNWQKQRIDFKVFLAGNIKVNFLIGFSDHGQIENTDFCYYSQRTSRELHIGNMVIPNFLIPRSMNTFRRMAGLTANRCFVLIGTKTAFYIDGRASRRMDFSITAESFSHVIHVTMPLR